MDQEVNTGGGPYVEKGVGTGGGDFVGRDSDDLETHVGDIQGENVVGAKNVTINHAATSDPADLLAAMRAQLNRVEDNLNWKMTLIERDIANIKLQVLILVIVTTLLFLAFTFVLVISVVNLERHGLLPMWFVRVR